MRKNKVEIKNIDETTYQLYKYNDEKSNINYLLDITSNLKYSEDLILNKQENLMINSSLFLLMLYINSLQKVGEIKEFPTYENFDYDYITTQIASLDERRLECYKEQRLKDDIKNTKIYVRNNIDKIILVNDYHYLDSVIITKDLVKAYLYNVDIFGKLILLEAVIVKDKLQVINSFMLDKELIKDILNKMDHLKENK